MFRSCNRSRSALACASDRKKFFQPISQRRRHPARAAAQDVPKGRLAGVRRVTAILQQGNIEARNLARTCRAEGQPPIVRSHDFGQRQGEFQERAIHGTSASQHEAAAQERLQRPAGTIGQPVLTQERGMHRPPRGIDHRGIAIDQLRNLAAGVGFGFLQGLHLPGDFVGLPDVVLIGRQDIVGPVVPCLLEEPGKIAHRAPPQAIVCGDDDPPILLGRVVQDLPRGVAAAVVPDEQGPVGIRLGLNAPQQFGQPGFALVGGQQDIDAGWGHNSHYNGFIAAIWSAVTYSRFQFRFSIVEKSGDDRPAHGGSRSALGKLKAASQLGRTPKGTSISLSNRLELPAIVISPRNRPWTRINIAQLLGILAIVLAAARLLGSAARWIGQPAVLGELLAGVLLGASVLGLLDPGDHHAPQTAVLHFLQEVGVVILLFEIGLETDLIQLLRAGASSTAVAVAGVVLPFAGGYLVCHFFGLDNIVCIVAGAALTATSVGITARVLNDLGRLHEPESQIVLGAAVIDDILGLIILTVVSGLAAGQEPTVGTVAGITALAFGFLIGTLAVGSFVVPPLARWLDRLAMPGMLTTFALLLAFGLAWGAEMAGSASIIGAFAAGLLLRRTPQAHDIEKAIVPLGHFFVPIFFVVVGASVDVRTFAPHDAARLDDAGRRRAVDRRGRAGQVRRRLCPLLVPRQEGRDRRGHDPAGRSRPDLRPDGPVRPGSSTRPSSAP